MPVPDLIRDSFIGQLVYHGSGRRYFQFEEEKPGFVVPARYLGIQPDNMPTAEDGSRNSSVSDRPLSTSEKQQSEKAQNANVQVSDRADATAEVAGAESSARQSREDVEKGITTADINLVDFDGPDDPDHPFNVCDAPTCFCTH